MLMVLALSMLPCVVGASLDNNGATDLYFPMAIENDGSVMPLLTKDLVAMCELNARGKR